MARLAKVAGMTVYSIRNAAGDMNATARKRKILASVFGPPRKLRFFSISTTSRLRGGGVQKTDVSTRECRLRRAVAGAYACG